MLCFFKCQKLWLILSVPIKDLKISFPISLVVVSDGGDENDSAISTLFTGVSVVTFFQTGFDTAEKFPYVLRQAKNSVSFLPSPCLCKHQECANSLKTTSGLSFRIPRKFQFILQHANRGSVCAPLGVIEIWQYTVAEAGPSLYRKIWAQCLMLQRGVSRASEQSGRMDVRWGREKKKEQESVRMSENARWLDVEKLLPFFLNVSMHLA